MCYLRCGVEYRILKGQLAWLIFIIIALAYNVVVRFLPKKAWGYPSQSASVEDEEGQ